MATPADLSTTLAHLQQPPPLSILKLSNPILHPKDDTSANPSTLAADLAHYRDLFSKLRFSYVEQVTKERFLRTICAEQPEFATAAENAELQTRLLADKAQLKEKKTEVAEMILALEAQGRELAKRKFSFFPQKKHHVLTSLLSHQVTTNSPSKPPTSPLSPPKSPPSTRTSSTYTPSTPPSNRPPPTTRTSPSPPSPPHAPASPSASKNSN
jgi:hypothetical protein